MNHDVNSETQGFHNLREAMTAPGCPICTVSANEVTRYMRSTNYDGVADPGIRQQFERSLGFCNAHAYLWLETAFVLGTAQMYRDLVRLVRRQLDQPKPAGGIFARGRRESGLPVAQTPCPVCELQERVESSLVATLVRGLVKGELVADYEASTGCCLPHLHPALAQASGNAERVLRQHAITAADALLAHLDETVRKHDYRFRHEPAGSEVGSPARAVRFIAGALGTRPGGKA